MKTTQTNPRKDQVMIKDLFKELFYLQMELEKHNDPNCQHYEEIKKLIAKIDHLMQCLLMIDPS